MALFFPQFCVLSSYSPLFSRTVFLQVWSFGLITCPNVVECLFNADAFYPPPRFPRDSESLGRGQKYTCLIYLCWFLCTLRPENQYCKNHDYHYLLLQDELQQFSCLILSQVYRWPWRTSCDANSGPAILVLRKKLYFNCTVIFYMDKSWSSEVKLCYLGSTA